jgi:MoaA/NifB/PqqE/SkfB family radical SAM enzyme
MISLYNLYMVMRLLLNKDTRNLLLDMRNYFKEDETFSMIRWFKSIFIMIKGEKIIKFGDKYILHSFLPPIPSNAIWSNFKATLTNTNKYTQHCNGKRSAPLSMYLSITSKCPHDCQFCSVKDKNKNVRELTTEEWTTTIKKLQNMGTAIIGFTGGEPMIRSDIVDLVKTVDDRSFSFIFTSGVNLTIEKIKELKEAGLWGLGISIPSNPFIKENEDRTTMALKAMIRSKMAGIYTTAHIVLTPKDITKKHLFKVFKLLKPYVNDIRIFSPMFSGSMKHITNPQDYLLTEEDKQKFIKIQFQANRRPWMTKVTSDLYTERGDKMGCNAALLHSYIDSEGNMCPCDFWDEPFGNVVTGDISRLWNDMRIKIKSPSPVCEAHNRNIRHQGSYCGKELLSFCGVKGEPIFYKKMRGK